MLFPEKFVDDTYWLGVNDLHSQIFESLWPLTEGVSLNSYLINDEKTALIDTVSGPAFENLLDKIRSLLGEGKSLDYVVINHMEPDHSGALTALLKFFPDLVVVGNKKTMDILDNLFAVDCKKKVIEEGDVLDLGRHKLEFFMTPMVHWPETMMTFDQTTGALYSGDVFGAFKALAGGVFDDQLDLSLYEDETLRYYSNILGRFSAQVQRSLQKINNYEVKAIAPTHGPIYRKNPQYIVDLYDKYSRFEGEPGVVIAFASMYGNTEVMAQAIAHKLNANQVGPVVLHNVSVSHISFILRDIWKYKGFVMGSCTYNNKLFPLMQLLLGQLDPKMMKAKKLALFGSFSWSGGALRILKETAEKNKWPLVSGDLDTKGSPKSEDLARCESIADELTRELSV